MLHYKSKHKVNNIMLTLTSAAALMVAVPALANADRTAHQGDVPHYDQQDVEKGMENAKETVSKTAEDVSDAVTEMYTDLKDVINGGKISDVKVVKVNPEMTADYMIGEAVYNEKGERVALIKDIIIDENGKAMLVVLGDGNWTGLGKMAAFDYDAMTNTNEQGDIVAPLTESMIDSAATFSYDGDGVVDKSVKVIPRNGYSLARLLDASLENAEGDDIGEIDNITLHNGKADMLIVSYNQFLGLGGEQVALQFDEPELIKEEGEVDFKLNKTQSQQFEAYKKAADSVKSAGK